MRQAVDSTLRGEHRAATVQRFASLERLRETQVSLLDARVTRLGHWEGPGLRARLVSAFQAFVGGT